MTPEAGTRDTSRTSRRATVLGPLFGLACLVATSSGVVVLSILLGAVVVAVVPRGRPAARSATCSAT